MRKHAHEEGEGATGSVPPGHTTLAGGQKQTQLREAGCPTSRPFALTDTSGRARETPFHFVSPQGIGKEVPPNAFPSP